MEGRKSFVLESIGFAFRSLIDHVRLFVIVLLAGTGVIALVVGLVGLLNKGFIQAVMSSQALQDYQECVGYNCATIAYQSGASVMSLVSANMFSLLISAVVLAIFFVGLDLGFKKIALGLYDRSESSLKTMFSCFGSAPKALIGWILYSLMVWVGWLLFVFPGFIALLRFSFFPYFIVDKNARYDDRQTCLNQGILYRQRNNNGTPCNLYPNPTTGEVTFTYSLLDNVNANLVVTDNIGRIVMKYNLKFETNNLHFNVGHLQQGIYNLLMMAEDGSNFTNKLTVIH